MHDVIQGVFAEVRPEVSGYPGQRTLQGNIGFELLILFLGFAAAPANHRLQPVNQLDTTGRAGELAFAFADIIVVLAHALDTRMHREDRLGMFGGKITPAIRRAGLPQHWPTLRRRTDKGSRIGTEITSLVRHLPDFRRVGVHPAGLVGDDRPRLPGVPILVAKLQVFLHFFVAVFTLAHVCAIGVPFTF